MDGFNDNFESNNFEADPAAEFLAREQNNLAGLEDDIPPITNGIPGEFVMCRIKLVRLKTKL